MSRLSTGLAELGWPRKHLQRVVQETSDHWDDLESDAREQGLEGSAAQEFAKERIGAPEELIRFHQEKMRRAHWSGRHRILTFVVMPPLLLVLWFMVWTVLAVGAGELYTKLLALPHGIWKSHLLVLVWAKTIHYAGTVAVPAFFWWWARRTFNGRQWGWVACGACALHGLLNHVTVGAHRLQWGYGLAAPDWLPVIAPLVVGATAYFYTRPKLLRLAVPLLLTALTISCASSKAPRDRGWIGGEYKKTSAGVLITRLSTNAPAARHGLLEGDLIKRVEGKRIRGLREFRNKVDSAKPGSHLSIEVVRDGVESAREVVVGVERFSLNRSITVGVLLSREWDLWPNPEFSLVAAGYKRRNERMELDSPEARFEFSKRDRNKAAQGLRSREGWEVWLPVCSFSSRKRILAQTGVE